MTDHADLLFINGTIHTLEPGRPAVDRLAARDGVVVAVGEEADGMRTTGTRLVDLAGACVLPGLLDVHNHHVVAGQADIFECNFLPSASAEEIFDAVRQWSSQLAPGAWIVGGSWGSDLLGQLNTAGTLGRLDEASNGHPAMLRDDSKHNRWANSAALRRAGVTDSTPDPMGGQILRDSRGRATGVMIEAGGVMIERALAADQPQSVTDLAAASRRGIEMLHSYGITGFQEAATSLQMMQAFKRMDDEGDLRAWVVSSMQVNDFIFGTDPLGEGIIAHREEYRTRHHRPDFIKIFLDGVPTSHTAAFLEPYLPDDVHGHDYHGYTTMRIDELERWLMATAERRISAKIHCTGDASVHMVLDVVERVRAAGHDRPRYQVAHGQFVHPDDIPRFRALNVSADISPTLWFPGVIHEAIKMVLPAERASRMQPNRSLLDAGALVAGGSDWPVSVSPNVWEGVYGLVTRSDPTGQFPGTLWPEEAVTREEAIAIYTTASAEAMGLADVCGSLSSGKSADLVVLSADPFSVDVDELPTMQAQQTWFAGEQVHELR